MFIPKGLVPLSLSFPVFALLSLHRFLFAAHCADEQIYWSSTEKGMVIACYYIVHISIYIHFLLNYDEDLQCLHPRCQLKLNVIYVTTELLFVSVACSATHTRNCVHFQSVASTQG